jgi:hypothetical protein
VSPKISGHSPSSAASAQTQNQPPRSVQSRTDEMLDRWNDIGNKLIAMAKDFPEDKYDFKLQKDGAPSPKIFFIKLPSNMS